MDFVCLNKTKELLQVIDDEADILYFYDNCQVLYKYDFKISRVTARVDFKGQYKPINQGKLELIEGGLIFSDKDRKWIFDRNLFTKFVRDKDLIFLYDTQGFMKLKHKNIKDDLKFPQSSGKEPATYFIDESNQILYFYDCLESLYKYDLKTGKKLEKYKYKMHNRQARRLGLKLSHNLLFYSSNSHLWVFDKDLNFKQNILEYLLENSKDYNEAIKWYYENTYYEIKNDSLYITLKSNSFPLDDSVVVKLKIKNGVGLEY